MSGSPAKRARKLHAHWTAFAEQWYRIGTVAAVDQLPHDPWMDEPLTAEEQASIDRAVGEEPPR